MFLRCSEGQGLRLKVQYELCVACTLQLSLQNLLGSEQRSCDRVQRRFLLFQTNFYSVVSIAVVTYSHTSQNTGFEAEVHFPALFQAVADTSVFTSPDPRNYFTGNVRLQPQQCNYGQWDFGSCFCLGQHGNSPFSVSIHVVSS